MTRGPANAGDGAGVLAWGGGRLWVSAGSGASTALSDELSAVVAPVTGAGACWYVAGDGSLRLWRRGEDRARPQRTALEAPVHALAASTDGRWVLAAHGQALSLLDGELRLVKRYEGDDLARRRRSAANWLAHHRRRRSFIAAWPELGELWEIQLDPAAPPIHDGLVHDYRMGEAIASDGYLGVRRAPLALPVPAFSFASEDADWVAGQHAGRVIVVHLDVRRAIAALDIPDARPRGSALVPQGNSAARSWWVPGRDGVRRIDPARWVLLGREEPGFAVQALAVLGHEVWALAGEAGAALLLRHAADRWSAARLAIGAPLSLQADAAGRQLLAVGREGWQRHGADGALLERWAAPSGHELTGAAWLPA